MAMYEGVCCLGYPPMRIGDWVYGAMKPRDYVGVSSVHFPSRLTWPFVKVLRIVIGLESAIRNALRNATQPKDRVRLPVDGSLLLAPGLC